MPTDPHSPLPLPYVAALLASLTLAACGQGPTSPVSRARADVPLASAATGVSYRAVREQMAIPITSGDSASTDRMLCVTCHAMLTPNPTQRGGASLRRFHQEVEIRHGGLTCLSCHNPGDYQSLRLADGRSVPVSEAQQLCAQCHGTQARAYAHGAHGGMTGAWDASRGTQVRNRCTHCHAPHAPAFPSMWPTFKPRDRFQEPGRGPRDE